MSRQHTTRFLMVVLTTLALALSGCTGAPDDTARTPDGSPDVDVHGGSSVSGSEQIELATRHATTVIDDGDSVLLCTSGEFQMMPPGCIGGVTLQEWDWAVVPDMHEHGGVRWGEYGVTGTWNAAAGVLTVTGVDPGREADALAPSDPSAEEAFRTPCTPPSGGWSAVTEPPTTDAARDAAIVAASAEPGFASAWRGPHEEAPVAVLNVSTAGAVEAMIAAVRAHWGGPLCVSSTARSAADIDRIRQDLAEQTTLPISGVGWGGTTDLHISVHVVYDDGTLQRQLDEQYGVGAVGVSSSLVPAD